MMTNIFYKFYIELGEKNARVIKENNNNNKAYN